MTLPADFNDPYYSSFNMRSADAGHGQYQQKMGSGPTVGCQCSSVTWRGDASGNGESVVHHQLDQLWKVRLIYSVSRSMREHSIDSFRCAPP